MLKRSTSLGKEIKNEDKVVAFLNAQVTSGYESINFSIQIIDKQYIGNNPLILKQEYESFMEDIKNEAINNGWEALREAEATLPEETEKV